MTAVSMSWLIAVTSAVTAGASLSTLGLAWTVWKTQQQHDRAIYGSEGIDGWEGLLAKVAENREALEERGDL